MAEEIQGSFVDDSEDDVILPGELATEEEEIEEPQETPQEAQPEQEAEPQPEPEPEGPPPIVLTQEQLNQIVQDRLTRDRRVREQEYAAQQQQAQVQQQQEQEWGNYYNQLVNTYFNDKYQFYAGTLQMDDEVAKQRAAQEAEVEARRDYELAATKAQIQQQQATQQQREAHIQRITAYERDKAMAMRNPVVARYMQQIDEFSGGGARLSFEVAKRYVLGQAIDSELSRARQTEQQRTLANVNSRKNIGVMQGSQAGANVSKTSQLSAAEKRMAAKLGVSLKEYASHKK